MNTTPEFVILIGLGTVVLVLLLALLVNLFRQLTRLALAVGIILAFCAISAVALSLITWPMIPSPVVVNVDTPAGEQPAPVAHPGPSAATTVTGFLLAVIAISLLASGGTVVGWHWWKEYQRRRCSQEMLQQAQIYALTSGERLPTGLPRRLPQGGNVIVVGGQQPQPQIPHLPDSDKWEVLQ